MAGAGPARRRSGLTGRQAAALERLRADRQREGAMVRGPGPLHLAEVFGLDEKTAMRYADSARALPAQPAEVNPAGRARTHGSIPRKRQHLLPPDPAPASGQ